MVYSVQISPSANQDIDGIFLYIAQKLNSPKAAMDLAEKLEEKIDLLAEQPFMFELSRDDRLYNLGYRRIVIDNYVLLYTEDEKKKTVFIAGVFYGGQSYEKYL